MAEGKNSVKGSWRRGVKIRLESKLEKKDRFSEDGRRASTRISKEVVR